MFRTSLVQNAQMSFVKRLGTSKFFFDKEESMLKRRRGEKVVEVVDVRDHDSIRESFDKVRDGNIVPKGIGSANDMVLGFVKEASDLVQVLKYLWIGRQPCLGMLPRDPGVVVVEQATKVLVFEDPVLIEKVKGGSVRGFRFHEYDVGEVVVQEVESVGGRGSEMYDSDLLAHKVSESHDFGLLEGMMNGLIRFERDLIFVNDDENMFERLDFIDKVWKLIAVKDRVVILGREPGSCLNHPVDRGEARNDKDMIDAMFRVTFHGVNDGKHGARFARLRQGHGQNTENGGIEKDIGDFQAKFKLIGKHSVKCIRSIQ